VSPRSVAVTAALVLVATLAGAQVPVRQEQFVYSILAFNGKDYTATFTPGDAGTLYLIADVKNFLAAGNVFVYFWPLTKEWKTDTSVLDMPFRGTLELTGGRLKEPRLINRERYTYYNERGEYELNWRVATGYEADRTWLGYQQAMDEYFARMRRYSRDRADYEAKLSELRERISRLRDQGQDASGLVKALQTLPIPTEPKAPTEYVVPPRPVQEAFVLSLPVGEYRIRFLTEDGSVMEGSERRVVSFRRRRAEGIGLEVIPGDKWTRPVDSTTPSSVLYVNGSADLYLRPFFEQEYNDLFYEKMQRNDARGNPGVMKWVRIQQVPHAGIRFAEPGGQERILAEEPFFVEQLKGASLGYRILPWDPSGEHKDQGPGLIAFHLPISEATRAVRLATLDENGIPLPGGERQIRVVRPAPRGNVALVLTLLPLVVMAVVLIIRSRRSGS
jgi:hypothetical protein